MTKQEEKLTEMLEEVRLIRQDLAVISDATSRFAEAIRGVLDCDDTEPGSFEEAYRVLHEDL